MKRILTSILILLVLTLSAHPILSMHFCQGELQSFNIHTLNKSNACCMTSAIEDVENNITTLPSSGIQTDNICCSTSNLEVVTDSFIQNNNETIRTSILSNYISGWFIFNYLFNIATPDTTVQSNLNYFSQGFFLKTLDFLSLVCIYRI